MFLVLHKRTHLQLFISWKDDSKKCDDQEGFGPHLSLFPDRNHFIGCKTERSQQTRSKLKNWHQRRVQHPRSTTASPFCDHILLDITIKAAREDIDSDREVCTGSAVSCLLINSINYLHWTPDNPTDTCGDDKFPWWPYPFTVWPISHYAMLKKHKHTLTLPW